MRSFLCAETAGQIYLMDGKIVSGWIQRVDSKGVVWKIPSENVGSFPMQNVREIRLQAPEDFLEAARQLDSEPNSEAKAVLRAYADPTNPDSFYPVPGNLASRAAHILFRHHLSLGQVEDAAAWALRTEFELLPQRERPALLDLYRSLVPPPDDLFFERARKMLKDADPGLSLEIKYLLAVGHDLRGENTQALAAYARVFSPAGGAINPYGEFALTRAIRLLQESPPASVREPAQLIKSLQKTRDFLYISP